MPLPRGAVADSERGPDPRGAEPPPFYRSATVARTRGPDRARTPCEGSCDHAADGSRMRSISPVAASRARGCGPRRAWRFRRRPRPVLPSRPLSRRSSSAGPSSRSHPRDGGGDRLVAVGRPPCSRPSGEPGAAPADLGVPRRDARARLRAAVGDRAVRHALFSVHMVQHVLLMLVAAPLIALAAPSRLSCASAHRRLDGLDPPRTPLAGHADPGPPGRRLAAVRGDDVGGPFLAAVRRSLEDPLVHDLEHVCS